MIGVLPGARALLLLAAVSLAQAQNTTTVKPATPLLLNDAERIVVFGDSYSANVYQVSSSDTLLPVPSLMATSSLGLPIHRRSFRHWAWRL